MIYLKNNKYQALAIIAVFLAVLSGVIFMYDREPAVDYSLTRVIRYSFTIQNTTGQRLQNEDFWTYAPVKQTSFQITRNINASHPYLVNIDESGNQQLHFKLDLPPYGVKVISLEVELALSKAAVDLTQTKLDKYSGTQKYIETNNEKIITLASRLSADNSTEALNKSFSWVAQNIKYAGYIEDDRGALYALNNKQGDCTEYMYLFTALARVQGVPARAIGGFVVAEDAVLKARDFHNWSEVYVDGKWRVVDPQHKHFMENESRYIAMRVITGQVNNATSTSLTSHGLFGAGKELRIAMD